MTQDIDTIWQCLTPAEKWSLLAYRIYATKAEAARQTGKSVKWLERSQRAHPAFRQAMDSRGWPTDELERRILLELFSEALIRLWGR